METVQRTFKEMEAAIELWGAEADEMAAKLELPGAQASADYRGRIKAVMLVRKVAQLRLDEFHAAEGGAWEFFRDGVERSWTELGRAVAALRPTVRLTKAG